MIKKAILIVPYFGSFPSFFQLFLNSCKFNPDFNWLFFTDDRTPYDYPENTKVVYTTFEVIKKDFKKKLGEDIVMIRPHKLCDYKVTYGFVFQDWIADYEYWGHCDVDVIYGNLSEFINPLIEKEYDKIFSLGHFSLYKNTPEVNTIFQNPINGKRVYQIVFNSDYGFAFDEWHCPLGGINQIFEKTHLLFFKKNLCANLSSKTKGFQLSDYDLEKENYYTEKEFRQVFSWDRGDLKRYYIENGLLKEKTYPYIHFHKRNMKMDLNGNFDKFLIVPNKFIPFQKNEVTKKTILHFSKKQGFNTQWIRVKYINLRYRIKQLLNKL